MDPFARFLLHGLNCSSDSTPFNETPCQARSHHPHLCSHATGTMVSTILCLPSPLPASQRPKTTDQCPQPRPCSCSTHGRFLVRPSTRRLALLASSRTLFPTHTPCLVVFPYSASHSFVSPCWPHLTLGPISLSFSPLFSSLIPRSILLRPVHPFQAPSPSRLRFSTLFALSPARSIL